MRYEEMVDAVEARAELPSRAAAERVTAGTLETLAEHIPTDLAAEIAERLPYRAGRYLRHPPVKHRFDRRGFYGRVHQRADGPEPVTAYGARVVLELLAEIIADEAADKRRGESSTAADLVGKLYQAMPPDLRYLVRHRNHAPA